VPRGKSRCSIVTTCSREEVNISHYPPRTLQRSSGLPRAGGCGARSMKQTSSSQYSLHHITSRPTRESRINDPHQAFPFDQTSHISAVNLLHAGRSALRNNRWLETKRHGQVHPATNVWTALASIDVLLMRGSTSPRHSRLSCETRRVSRTDCCVIDSEAVRQHCTPKCVYMLPSPVRTR
jgi:hypothetical protein